MIAIGREYCLWDADHLWEILGKLQVPDISNCSFNMFTVQCSYKSPKISLQKLNIVVEWSWVRERAVFNSFHSSEIQRSNKREIQQVSLQIYNELKQRNIKEMFESFKIQYCCTANMWMYHYSSQTVVDVLICSIKFVSDFLSYIILATFHIHFNQSSSPCSQGKKLIWHFSW